MIHDTIQTSKSRKIQFHPNEHIPNKDESKLLRKLKKETGMSENEIREIKKYRIMLSDAQKQSQIRKHSRDVRWCRKMIKFACSKTGLAPQHPDTIKALQEELNYRYTYNHHPWSMTRIDAKTMVKNYAK
jgi:hypothetical protein